MTIANPPPHMPRFPVASRFLVAIAACLQSVASIAMPAPDWVKAIEPGTWQAVSLNTLASVDPARDPGVNPNHPGAAPWRGNTGQSSVIVAWNGGALASGLGEKGSLVVWGGGHQDYYGNEIYAFDLGTRLWRRVTDPYSGAINFPYTDGIFPDGSPSPPHIYDQIEYHPPSNSLVVLRTMASNDPNNVPVAATYSFTTRQWRRSARNSMNHSSSGGWSAYDSLRGVIWAEGGYGTSAFTRFDPVATDGDGRLGTWTNFSPKRNTVEGVAARDPVRDLLVIADFGGDGYVYAVDLKNPSSAAVRLAESGSAPTKRPGSGWEWSDTRQAFLYWEGSGSRVSEFKLSGSNWRTASWGWASITSPQNAVTPQNGPGAKPYSRFRIMRYDDEEIAIAVTDIGGPVYAFRVSGTTMLRVPNPPDDFVAD